MEQPLLLQANQFLCAALLGAGLGIFYDLLRGLRRSLRFLTHLLDFLFALSVLVCNLLFALYVGNGQYRIFMLLGSALGAAVYFLTLSRLFVWVFSKFGAMVAFPLRQIGRVFKKILEKIKKIAKNIFSTAKKSVKINRQKSDIQEELHDAPAQIVTHYQTHSIGGHGIRNRDDRHASAQNQRAQGRKSRAQRRYRHSGAGQS